jgi:hypothetical protein
LFRLKAQVQQSVLHLQHTQTPTFTDGAGLRGLDVDSVNSSSDYFEYVYIPASETILHQKRMSNADRSHLRRQTVETNRINEPCLLDRVAARLAWITVVLYDLSFNNCVALLALDTEIPVS